MMVANVAPECITCGGCDRSWTRGIEVYQIQKEQCHHPKMVFGRIVVCFDSHIGSRLNLLGLVEDSLRHFHQVPRLFANYFAAIRIAVRRT